MLEEAMWKWNEQTATEKWEKWECGGRKTFPVVIINIKLSHNKAVSGAGEEVLDVKINNNFSGMSSWSTFFPLLLIFLFLSNLWGSKFWFITHSSMLSMLSHNMDALNKQSKKNGRYFFISHTVIISLSQTVRTP